MKSCIIIPVLFIALQIEDLSLDQLIPDLSQGREIRNLFLEHQENYSSSGRRNFGCTLLPIIQAQVLKILKAAEADTS